MPATFSQAASQGFSFGGSGGSATNSTFGRAADSTFVTGSATILASIWRPPNPSGEMSCNRGGRLVPDEFVDHAMARASARPDVCGLCNCAAAATLPTRLASTRPVRGELDQHLLRAVFAVAEGLERLL